MTVVENLLTGRHARIRSIRSPRCCFCPAVRREEVRQREAVEKIIEFVELERYRHAAVGSLPFGIQKIVGFARALALEPAVLLLDEPSAGLNREEREDLARFILRIKHELGICDDLDRARHADGRRPGRPHPRARLRADAGRGPPADVLKHPDVVRAYIGATAQ